MAFDLVPPNAPDVVKSNVLIKAVHNNQSLMQWRLLLAALTQIRAKETLEPGRVFHVRVAEIAGSSTRDGKSLYSLAKAAAKGLLETAVFLPTDRPSTFCGVSLARKITYAEGVISLQFSEGITPYISELSRNFTKLDPKILMSLEGFYSSRLYELLLCTQSGKFQATPDELRALLGCEGKYQNPGIFKSKVILRAIRDIEAVTDLRIEFHQSKSGKAIAGYHFRVIRPGKPKRPPAHPKLPERQSTMLSFGEILAQAKET